MAYTGVYVFGDSLVDAGNALKLAEFYGTLTFSDLPDGAPTAAKGYHQGRFSDGYTFADLLANKEIGTVTKPIFPYGYEDPWLGVLISPFSSDPVGKNLNFAYGGAQVRQGKEVVPDLDGQTDTFKDAVNNRADPAALYVFTMGGNDVRSLAPAGSDPVPQLTAEAALREVAQQLVHEISQLIAIGVRNIVITGIPDVGLIPKYDDEPGAPGYGPLEGEEIVRSEAATRYSQYLDNLIQTQVVPALVNSLVSRGVARGDAQGMVDYVQIMDHRGADGAVTSTGAFSKIMPTLEQLHGLAAGELATNMLAHQNVVFFDRVHPNAQTHALISSYMQAQISNATWVETMPLLGADVDYRTTGSIAVAGEVDTMVVAMAPGTSYSFQMLGVSSLTAHVFSELGYATPAGGLYLGDPTLRLLSPAGVEVRADQDRGVGVDALLTYDVTSAGNYSLKLSAAGALTGTYVLTATVSGAANGRGDTYVVSSASTLVVEAVEGVGEDVVQTSVSYALAAGSEIELLQTTNIKGKTALTLTGNEFGQKIVGNAAANVIEGKGGADELWGAAGNDRFVLGTHAVLDRDGSETDALLDYASGDVVDISQVLKVASGTNVVGGGHVRMLGNALQVDLDGAAGADGWATLATVNGSGSVAVRYLSGGTLATVSLSRETAPAASVQPTASWLEPLNGGGGSMGDLIALY